MPQVTLYHGEPLMVDHTPGSNIDVGQVVVIGDITAVAHRPIASGEKGAVSVGGAVYQCTGAAAIAVGKKVWWDDSANKVTETATGNKVFGFTVTACAADGGSCYVVHNPAM